MKYNEKHAKRVEERGDGYIYLHTYEVGEITLDGKITKNKPYIRIKCPYCSMEYDIRMDGFLTGNKSSCKYCCNKYENSFAYHIQIELGEALNEYWDWEKNTVNPYCISKYSHLKVWIKCTNPDVSYINKIPYKNYHKSYEVSVASFSNGTRCPYCNSFASHKTHHMDSFAHYHIINTDTDFLEKYWSNKNTLDPWELSHNSSNHVWIICQENEYHGDYFIACYTFTTGVRCGKCHPNCGNTHEFDSIGYLYPELVMNWNYDKNEYTPFEVPPNSSKKFWFTCANCGSDYQIRPNNLVNKVSHAHCKKCNNPSKGEFKIMDMFDKLNIDYVYNEEYFKDLKGVGGRTLRPDFILKKYKIWVEFDGEFHYKDFYKDGSFERLIEHDRRKNEYAIEHGWKLIRIPYWEFDNIENILMGEINKNYTI